MKKINQNTNPNTNTNKKNGVDFIKKIETVISVIIALVFMAAFIYVIATQPKTVSLETGWNKVEIVNCKIPKGAIIITDKTSNLLIPAGRFTTKQPVFLTEGVVFVYEKTYFVAQGPIWVYLPEYAASAVKISDFFVECDTKLRDLSGDAEDQVLSQYFVGHP